jgi:phosphoglycolate phosphatase
MSMKLILFDIDGTLIWSNGAGREAMNRALLEVLGTSGPASSIPMAGKIDWQIITELLIAAGFDRRIIEARRTACFEAITRHMARTTRERQPQVCPGVPELLVRLATHPQVTLGLLTGNLATTAPIKLRAADINPALFRVGAYGSDASSRSQLVSVAIARAQALTGHSYLGKKVVIVGDTPADVTCGKHLGVTAIGVATGPYSLEALSNAGADHVFADLTDKDVVLQAIL